MEIKVLGTGCANCKRLEATTREAVASMQLDATITKVEDITRIMSYGVMRTPALVINEKVVLYGRIPTIEEVKTLIQREM
jgi:small redox-active disulfide protein 2